MFHIHSFSDSSVTGATVKMAYQSYGDDRWYPEVHTHCVCACGAAKAHITKLPPVMSESLAWYSVVAYLRLVSSQATKHLLLVAMTELETLFESYARAAATKESSVKEVEELRTLQKATAQVSE